MNMTGKPGRMETESTHEIQQEKSVSRLLANAPSWFQKISLANSFPLFVCVTAGDLRVIFAQSVFLSGLES